MIAIFKHDFKGYFQTPLGFVFLAAFFFFSAIPFRYLFASGSNYVSGVFSSMYLIFLILLSLLTMNLLSEERRHKTDQVIFTAPISIIKVVFGKFLAATCVFTIGIMITVVYSLITSFFIMPDWKLFISGFIGMYLSGIAIIAIGLFVSSITESQVISAVITSAVIIMITLVDSLSEIIGTNKLDWLFNGISFMGRFNSFVVGILEISNIIFFLSVVALFLFFTARVLERRRWA